MRDQLDDLVRAEQAHMTETRQLPIVLAGSARQLRVERRNHAVAAPRDRKQLAAIRNRRSGELAEKLGARRHLLQRGAEAAGHALHERGGGRAAVRCAERDHAAQEPPLVEALQEIGRHQSAHGMTDHVDRAVGVGAGERLDLRGGLLGELSDATDPGPDVGPEDLILAQPSPKPPGQKQETAAKTGPSGHQHDHAERPSQASGQRHPTSASALL
jgi:hypothetical protein